MGAPTVEAPQDPKLQLEQARLDFDRQRHLDEQRLEATRLDLETSKARVETRFLTRHFGAIVTALVSMTAVVVSLSQVWINSQSKRSELELAERAGLKQLSLADSQNARDWNIRAAEFIAAHENLVFSDDPEKRQVFASLLLAAFPPEVTSSVVQRLAASAPTAAAKSLWTTTGATATGLSLGRIEGPQGGAESGWMSSGEYVQEFIKQRDLGNYPFKVEGRTQGGLEQFRADFRPSPPGVSWQSYHWMDKADYDQRNQALSGAGYTQESMQTFIDSSGATRYLATWARKQ